MFNSELSYKLLFFKLKEVSILLLTFNWIKPRVIQILLGCSMLSMKDKLLGIDFELEILAIVDFRRIIKNHKYKTYFVVLISIWYLFLESIVKWNLGIS